MPADGPIIFVVDDDISVRESLDALLRIEGWETQTFASAEEFLARPRVRAPSCLILDVNLPDSSGLDLQEHIASGRADMSIVFITGHGDIPTTVRAMKAGAVEFLTKPFDDRALLDAVRQGLARSEMALQREKEMLGLREHYGSLSRREKEVMKLVVSGRLNKLIGYDLGISEITVKAHRGQVMNKMHAASLADLVNMAARLGICRQ